MGSFSFGHWIIVLLVVILLFGRGRISETMADFGKGVRGFRKGLSDEGDLAVPVQDRDAGLPIGQDTQSVPVRPE